MRYSHLLFLSILFAGTLSLSSCDKDQVDQVPQEVQDAFAAHYPEAVKIEWSLKEKTFEVDFYLNDMDMEAEYDKSATRIEEEIMIDPRDLPQPIKDYINEHHRTLFIGEASIETVNGKSVYEVEMKKATFRNKDLEFDMEGNLISDEMFK